MGIQITAIRSQSSHHTSWDQAVPILSPATDPGQPVIRRIADEARKGRQDSHRLAPRPPTAGSLVVPFQYRARPVTTHPTSSKPKFLRWWRWD
jgi:hypothetical protein